MYSTYIPILLYHQISPSESAHDPQGLIVPTYQFEKQMNYLYEHGYSCKSMKELLFNAKDRVIGRNKVFALNFDDGYANFLTEAFPILQRYGFTATVFVVTDLVGKQSNWSGEHGTQLLSWKQIKVLQQAGISIGSHSCTHSDLTQLSNEDVWNEISSSKQKLEDELGHEISLMSYPYWESNNEIQDMAKAAGYKLACGVTQGSIGEFNLWRIESHRDDKPKNLSLKLSPGYRYAVQARRWIREKKSVKQNGANRSHTSHFEQRGRPIQTNK
ncbi:MAG: polysaccharide deacetylase family protein [Bacteroidales bacterium]|nr:polysaccharide deacetylase family protein [Bacteroidales bacterium]MCF8455821.1 polysaccharide deacetylase family protein [Bacteroidales bacterium]